MTSHIMRHADDQNISTVYSFRSKISGESQLIKFIDDISTNVGNGKQSDVLVMDFSKAFDKVSHPLLVHKLHHYASQVKSTHC